MKKRNSGIFLAIFLLAITSSAWANGQFPSASAVGNQNQTTIIQQTPDVNATASAEQQTNVGVNNQPTTTGVGFGGSASAWNYSPSSASAGVFIDQSRNNSPSYGTIGMGRAPNPAVGSYTPISPVKGRSNLRSGVEIVDWEIPSLFTKESWDAFRQGVIRSRGQRFWNKLEKAFDPSREGSAQITESLFVNPLNLPKIDGVRTFLKMDIAKNLLPGVDYQKVGGVQVDGLSEVHRQYLLVFALKTALDNRIPVVVLQNDSLLRAGTKKTVNNDAWSLGLGALFPGNTPTMIGPGYAHSGTTEIAREVVFAGACVSFLIPKNPDNFYKTAYSNRAQRYEMSLTGKKTEEKIKEAPISELAK